MAAVEALTVDGGSPGFDRAESLWKAIQILECFTDAEPELGVTELARRVHISKSTAYRLCQTLLRAGILEQAPSDKYQLGIRLFEIGNQVRSRLSIRYPAAPILHWVGEQTHEIVHLGVRSDLSVLYVSKVEPPGSRRLPSLVGTTQPLHATAIGKSLLAWAPPIVIERLATAGLERRTGHTIVGAQQLHGELEKVRSSGVAHEREESMMGLYCVAVPIWSNGDEEPIAALSITTTIAGMDERNPSRLENTLRQAARELQKRLAQRQIGRR